jgi:hypothetical protein
MRKQTVFTDTVYQHMIGMRTFNHVQVPFQPYITYDAYMSVWYPRILSCVWQEVRFPMLLQYTDRA